MLTVLVPRCSPAAAALALAGLLAGCGSSGGSDAASVGTGTTAAASGGATGGRQVTGQVTVLAAASLKEAFSMLGRQFEAKHAGATVLFSFAASSDLATQITQGAPADVFASASTTNMDQVVTAGDAGNPTIFVKNVMEIVVPPGNPGKVERLQDLAAPKVKLALCQPQVPCGATAAQVFRNAGIAVEPVTLEADVKATLTKVTLGEVDAGVVYVTDVRAAGAKVKGIEIPADVNASTSYPIAPLTKAKNATGARAFVDYVLSPAGQQVLAADGFARP